ncbi:GIY-YIG nuclease family protein [Candidatus Uhrbacteria bacterium]|nr:GIY-YIG nuclease family protein [Candidatus Uhrbacteria bacterium]
MHYVYILHCADSKLYIGFSSNVNNRIRQHQAGEVKSTKNRLPVTLVCIECYHNQYDARSREVFLKSGAGHAQIKRQHQRRLSELGYECL